MTFDSRAEAARHKTIVVHYMQLLIDDLVERATVHDDSKFLPAEYELRDRYIPALRATGYGSAEYERICGLMQPAIRHHHARNRHHPEYFRNGISGMCLMDLMEMFCDWLAVTAGNGKEPSFIKAYEKYGFPYPLRAIFENTLSEFRRMGIDPPPEAGRDPEGAPDLRA